MLAAALQQESTGPRLLDLQSVQLQWPYTLRFRVCRDYGSSHIPLAHSLELLGVGTLSAGQLPVCQQVAGFAFRHAQ